MLCRCWLPVLGLSLNYDSDENDDNDDNYDEDNVIDANYDEDNVIDDDDNKEIDLIQLDLGHPPCTLAESHGVRAHAFHYDHNDDYNDDNLDHT